MKEDKNFEEIKQILKEANSRMRPIELTLPLKKLVKFCEIIDETNLIYRELSEAKKRGYKQVPIPESYLLTFISPITHEFFTTGIGKHMGKEIKGIIHTSSKIEFKEQLYCETTYLLEMDLKNVIQKKGKMGDFIDTMYQISLKNGEGKVCFVDYHEFFMKIN
ncbi:MAG: hypothetical protein EAX96_00900 [Candidatus Lokiarchaeota archaeon]|nr:hypothetical protein [Candidatus Lokiarchaeota archaeon]